MPAVKEIFATGFPVFSTDSTRLYSQSVSATYVFDAATGGYLGQQAGVTVPTNPTSDGSATIEAFALSGAASGNSQPYTVSVTSTAVSTGVITTKTTTIVAPTQPAFSSGGITYHLPVIALSNGTLLLSTVNVPAATTYTYLVDLTTGSFTATSAPGLGYTSFVADATHSRIVASVRTATGSGAGALAILDANGNVLATHDAGQDGVTGTFSGALVINVAANTVLQYTGTALSQYDTSLHYVGNLLPMLQAQTAPGTLTGITLSADGSHLYAINTSTRVLYEFTTNDWHLTRSYAVSDSFGYAFTSGSVTLSSDGHYAAVVAGAHEFLIDLTQSGQIDGTSGSDELHGTADLQVLYGYGGDDTLYDGAASSTLVGGQGNDTYFVTHIGVTPTEGGGFFLPTNNIVELAGGGTDTIVTSFSMRAPDNIEVLQLASGAVATLGANIAGSRLVGNDLGTAFYGSIGDDIFVPGRGDDIVYGGEGFDTVVIGATMASSTVEIQPATRSVLGGTPLTFVVRGPEGNDSLAGIEKIQFNDGAIYAGNAEALQRVFTDLYGRSPTVAELVRFSSSQTPASDAEVRAAILGSDAGIAAAATQITAAYTDIGGRAPTQAEIAAWTQALAGGTTNQAMRAGIAQSPFGQVHLPSIIAASYQQIFDRPAASSEIVNWQNAIIAGTSVQDFRGILLSVPVGKAHADAVVGGLYQDYFGRAASSGELTAWSGAIAAGTSFEAIRTTLLTHPYGQAHSASVISRLYDDYFGRDPNAAEIDAWKGAILSGATFGDLRAILLNHPYGQQHSATTIDAIYQDYFGRGAAPAEIDAWKGAIAAGADFDTLRLTLMAHAASDATGVERFSGTASADQFTFAKGFGDAVISGFDPAHDQISFHNGGYLTFDPLDAAHAREAHALDGSASVFLDLEGGDTILLTGVTLAQLHTSDFVL